LSRPISDRKTAGDESWVRSLVSQDAANARQRVELAVTGQIPGRLEHRLFQPRDAFIQLLDVFLLHRGDQAIGRMLVQRFGFRHRHAFEAAQAQRLAGNGSEMTNDAFSLNQIGFLRFDVVIPAALNAIRR
jgi:hypothetical protein